MDKTRNFIIHFLSALVLLAVGLLVIFYRYREIPAHLTWDELDFTHLAMSLSNQPYIPYSNLATGHSTLYFYILNTSLKLFGVNSIGLRLPSALFSVGSVILLYILFLKVFKNNIAAFAGALIMETSRWFINFSRFAFEAPFLLFLELSSLYFLLKINKNSTLAVIVTAFFVGLAFHSYTPGRIFFLVPLVYLLLMKNKKNLLIFIAVFLLVISPLLFYLFTHTDSRVDAVSVFAQNVSFLRKIEIVLINMKQTAIMFFKEGDWNGRHNYPGKPAINPLLLVGVLVGLFYSLIHIKQKYNFLFLLFAAVAFIPALLTIYTQNPNMLRTYTVLPALAFCVTVVVNTIINTKNNKHKYIVLSFAFGLILISSLYEIRGYFLYQSTVVKNAFELTCPLERMVQYEGRNVPKVCVVKKSSQ